jgi:hypothetical protein
LARGCKKAIREMPFGVGTNLLRAGKRLYRSHSR